MDKILGYVEIGKKEGAKLTAGGKRYHITISETLDINPFDTIGVCDTLTTLAHIWAQRTLKNHIKSRNEVSER